MQTLEFRAMNTSVLMAAEGQAQALEGLEAAKTFIQECEGRFSRFIETSELSRLNRSVGAWWPVSNELMDMLQESLSFHRETEGLFDPSVLPDLKRVGYDRTFDEISKGAEDVGHAFNGPIADTHPVGPRRSLAEIDFDWNGKRVRLPEGMEIDLGGLAKGWIVEKAAALLNTYSSACAVSAGGDMLFIGHPLDGSDWQVVLEDPLEPSRYLTLLHTGPGAVATSSIAKRSWKQAGKARHHLIDPRTGEPASTDWLSVTVFAPRAVVAEVYAKALLIGGEGLAAHLFSKRIDIAYLAVDPQGRLVGSSNSKEFLNAHNTLSA